jgi:hypothetical protein
MDVFQLRDTVIHEYAEYVRSFVQNNELSPCLVRLLPVLILLLPEPGGLQLLAGRRDL